MLFVIPCDSRIISIITISCWLEIVVNDRHLTLKERSQGIEECFKEICSREPFLARLLLCELILSFVDEDVKLIDEGTFDEGVDESMLLVQVKVDY